MFQHLSLLFRSVHSAGHLRTAGLLVFLVVLVPSAFADIPAQNYSSHTFRPGEKLTYELRWQLIPAGSAVLEVHPMAVINGTEAYHFSATVRSNSFIDNFYKVRDHIEAYASADMTRSLLYTKKQKEGKHHRDVKVMFNWEKGEAQYSNFGKKRKPVAIPPGTFDPLSVFYAFRMNTLQEHTDLEASVTDGKKHARGKAKVLGRETVSLVSGTYDTFLVEPDLRDIGGVFEKSPNARLLIWVTADEYRIPVKITSSVAVGNFVAELVSAQPSP